MISHALHPLAASSPASRRCRDCRRIGDSIDCSVAHCWGGSTGSVLPVFIHAKTVTGNDLGEVATPGACPGSRTTVPPRRSHPACSGPFGQADHPDKERALQACRRQPHPAALAGIHPPATTGGSPESGFLASRCSAPGRYRSSRHWWSRSLDGVPDIEPGVRGRGALCLVLAEHHGAGSGRGICAIWALRCCAHAKPTSMISPTPRTHRQGLGEDDDGLPARSTPVGGTHLVDPL